MTPFFRATVIAVAAFALDQASKWWVLEQLGLRERLRIEIAPFLNFVYARNTGVNFGLMASSAEGQQILLAVFAAAVSVALLVWSWRTRDGWIGVGCGLVVGGALGNALDRLREGAVVDFLNMDCCGIGNPYAFNVADAAIFLGAAVLAWAAWGKPEDAAKGAPEDERASARRASKDA